MLGKRVDIYIKIRGALMASRVHEWFSNSAPCPFAHTSQNDPEIGGEEVLHLRCRGEKHHSLFLGTTAAPTYPVRLLRRARPATPNFIPRLRQFVLSATSGEDHAHYRGQPWRHRLRCGGLLWWDGWSSLSYAVLRRRRNKSRERRDGGGEGDKGGGAHAGDRVSHVEHGQGHLEKSCSS